MNACILQVETCPVMPTSSSSQIVDSIWKDLDYTRQIMVVINSDIHTMFAATLFTMGTGKFQAASYSTAMAKGCPLVKINLPIIVLHLTSPKGELTHSSNRPPSRGSRYWVYWVVLGSLLKQKAYDMNNLAELKKEVVNSLHSKWKEKKEKSAVEG